MPQELLNSIHQYGFWLLFFLVFIQEIGVPTFPNEITLCYFGYLCSQKTFNLYSCLATAIGADILGTTLLYFIFFSCSKSIFKSKHWLLKRIASRIEKLKSKQKYSNNLSFLLGRLTPFVRGYVSVFAGTTQYSFKIYFIQIVISAILFTGGFLLLGFFLSYQIQQILFASNTFEVLKYSALFLFVFIVLKNVSKVLSLKKQ